MILPFLFLACTPNIGPRLPGVDTGTARDSTSDSAAETDSSADSGVVKPDTGVVAEVPGTEPIFSLDRGFYSGTPELVVEVDNPDAVLRYSLDGSDPRTSSTASESASPLLLTLDPGSEDGRDPSPGIVVRASACGDDGACSRVITHTYLFLDRLAELSPHDRRPGAGWPAPYEAWGTSDPTQSMDYGLDPRVTDDPDYAGLLVDAFTQIPSISLSTDLDNLFDEDIGIYANAMEHGIAWERPASVELLDPDDAAEIQVDAGIRIRGGWSRHTDNPKHAFRVFFRSDYGPTKLEYPLFGEEGADEFGTFDIRTDQNYSWSYKSDEGRENTAVRDVFSRDTQRDMGQPYTRSRYVHLYLNGVYWGLFQTQERSEADFAVTYLGGEEEDWDTVKVDGDDPSFRDIEATDGTLDAWRKLWDLCATGFASNAGWYEVNGLDAMGTRDPALPVLVDVDSLIDYMVVIFWTGNFDAPTGAFTGNDEPNNFYALYNRADLDHGFRFFVHDSEHALLADAWSPGLGLTEDRVNLGTRTDSYRMEVSTFEHFHPQWLHEKLSANANYRARFDERVKLWLAEGGVLSSDASAARFLARTAEIDTAIIAESARWGDSKSFREDGRTWRTRDDDWIPAVDRVVSRWCPARTAIVLGQLQAAGLYMP